MLFSHRPAPPHSDNLNPRCICLVAEAIVWCDPAGTQTGSETHILPVALRFPGWTRWCHIAARRGRASGALDDRSGSQPRCSDCGEIPLCLNAATAREIRSARGVSPTAKRESVMGLAHVTALWCAGLA